jgi:hypothetical protein
MARGNFTTGAERYNAKTLFDYLALRPGIGGFECHVDEQSARAWLAKYRPDVKLDAESCPFTPDDDERMRTVR